MISDIQPSMIINPKRNWVRHNELLGKQTMTIEKSDIFQRNYQ